MLRWRVFSLGLLIIVAGLYVFNQGTQILTPVAEMTGQISAGVIVSPVVSSTLLSVPGSNYSYLTATLRRNVMVNGVLQVEEGSQIGFYVMNSGNFTQWRGGNPSTIALANPAVSTYNFTFVPDTNGPYYFVFSNQDTGHKNVIFSLNTITYTRTPSPLIQYAAFELVLLGILFVIVGINTGKKKSKPWKEEATVTAGKPPKCKFCGKALATGELFCPHCGRSQN